ncbi:MAG: hypothetical protein ACKVRN_04500 [Pyrinomonadaceae bacterium]
MLVVSKIVGFILVLFSVVDAQSQHNDWKRYQSKDGFSVELPSPLLRVKYFDGEHGANWDTQPKWVMSYSSVETNVDEARFGINVMTLPASYTKGGISWEKVLEHLAILYIGDDDDSDPEIRREINISNHKATEYYFVRDDKGNTGSIYTRGRVFDLGRRKIIVLIFIGKNRADLDSKQSDQFFNSFALRK